MAEFIKKYRNRLKFLLAIFVLLLDFGFGTSRVVALDETTRSLNDIIFLSYNTCRTGNGEGSSSKLVGNDNIEKVLRYYVGKDLTLVQASAIVGNMMQESGVNPAKIQGGAVADETYKIEPGKGIGFGLVQWTDPGRQQELIDFAGSKPLIDLGMQLDNTWRELTGSYSADLAKLKATDDPVKAAIIVHENFENSEDTDEEVRTVRGSNAAQAYDLYKNKIPDGSTTASSAGAAMACTDKGGQTKFANDSFVIYNQRDPKWNDIWYGGPRATSLPCPPPTKEQDDLEPHGCVGSAGCGPSAMAMVITALTGGAVTPKETAEWGRDHGSVSNVAGDPAKGQDPNVGYAAGSNWNLHTSIGNNWGIKGTPIEKSVAAIEAGLRAGGLVVVSGAGESPWTEGGHLIAIRGIADSGKWLIADSNGKDNVGEANSKKEWDPADLVSRMGGYRYLFTK